MSSIKSMVCKGTCIRYVAKKGSFGKNVRYASGQKRCSLCSVFLIWDVEIVHVVDLSFELGLETQKDDINYCLQYQEINPDLSQLYKYKLSQKREEK